MDKDIAFLCKLTSLSESKLLTLLDDDYNLIIDQLASRPFYDGDFGGDDISLSLYAKLTIFRKADKNLALDEKAYVADCVSLHYPKLHKNSYHFVDNNPLKESTVQFYLVLLGMFPEYVADKANKYASPQCNFYAKIIRNGFKRFNRDNLADHSDYWLNLLHDIRTNYWH